MPASLPRSLGVAQESGTSRPRPRPGHPSTEPVMNIPAFGADLVPAYPFEFDAASQDLPAPADAAALTVADAAFAPSPDASAITRAAGPMPPVSAASATTSPSTPRSRPIVVLRGSVLLDADVVRTLREKRLLSQDALAERCHQQRIQVSIATIKRAETWHPVRYRIAHNLARVFSVPIEDLLH